MEKKLQYVLELMQQEKTEKARDEFLKIKPEETVEYWMIKGKLEQKFQNWGEAMNAFNKVLAIDNKNREAENNLHFIQNIINFWNPEMFNP
jgi:tetratricopeptide (TPR) repeat protein